MIDRETIRFLIENDEAVDHVSNDFINRLTAGINEVLRTQEQVAFLKGEMNGLRERYEENCGELDAELARLVKVCKHPSCYEHPDLEMVFVCNICGGIIDESSE